MKFLLTAVNAKYIHSNPALFSLRAYASEYIEHVEIAEYTINNRQEDILADIYKKKPDVIAFSCYIWNITVIKDLIVELHKLMPSIPIWVGGPEVSYDAEQVMKELPMLSGVMIGEGEATFLELMKYYVEGTIEVTDIKGIIHRGGRNADRPLTDLSTIPFLYHHLEEFENRIIYYESSRGCPFRCSYCLSSIDKQVRLRDINIVKEELQFFIDHKVTQVKFVDRTFNCNHKHAMAIWTYIKEHDNGITNFHFEISADILNEEELEMIHSFRPGLAQLEIGVQSTNPETIKAINRTMDVGRLSKIVARIKAGKNVHEHLDLIAGLPYEDYDTFVKSFNEVYDMKPEQLQLGFLKVLKGSLMHEKAEEYGIQYTSKPPYEVLYSKWLSYEDVLRLKTIEEMVELYYNSNQFTHTLPILVKHFQHAFEMYEALGKFYNKKGYFTNIPARSYRYHVLLEFAVETDEEHSELYKELLTYDMYLRENLKSRPDFAKNIDEEYKNKSRIFYQSEEQHRKYLKGYEEYNSKQMSKLTHIEIFDYDVLNIMSYNVITKLSKPQIVLFDYKIRNPLNFEATNIPISL